MAFGKPKSAPSSEHIITALQAMTLWLGPCRGEQHRQLWVANRDHLMALFAHGGRRPQAWWRFESDIAWPGFSLEKSTLWAAALLDEAERRELEASWYEVFNQSLEPGFSFQGLTGGEAHLEFLIFHDVPPELCERWAV